MGPNHNSIVARAPGPAMKGNASGNTEMSARRRLSACSSVEVRAPDSRANTISSASRNSNNPPKILNDSRLIPISSRNAAPPSANSSRMPAATTTAFAAMRRLYATFAPWVSLLNTGISETGSTTTKNTTKNFNGWSSMVTCTEPWAKGTQEVLESVTREAQHRPAPSLLRPSSITAGAERAKTASRS